ncbi:MAG: hypothetical protein ACK452_06735, partial [Bacteroidota bacterium]
MGKKKNIQSSKNQFYRKNKLEIILFLLSALIYSNTFLNGYNLDDEFVTGENTLCQQGLTGLKKIFTSHYTEGSNSKYNYEYRPVVKATFAIEYSLFGSSPKISHLINILIYSITVIILFRLLNFLFKENNKIFTFLVSVLFAVHPLHTEVVASLK